MPRRVPLSDTDAWMIVCSQHVDAEALSRQTGVKAFTIRNARARFRAKGWSCRASRPHRLSPATRSSADPMRESRRSSRRKWLAA